MPNATLEMACLFADRKVSSDLTGSLATIAELLKSIDPCLVLLADGDGEVIAVDRAYMVPGAGSGVNLDVAGELAHCMAARLLGEDRNECSFEFPTELGMQLAFAVRLGADAEEAVFGGLAGLSKRNRRRLGSWRATLRACGKLVWTAIRAKRAANEAQMRTKSLLAQQASLEASHVVAANGAILEREERIRQKLASDARMNAVLKTAADGIIVTDHSGVIETFNAAAQAIFGYHAVEVVGKRLATLLPLLDEEADAGPPRDAQNGAGRARDVRREVEGLRKDGTACPLELAISTVCVENQQLFTVIVRDVSERKRAEEELRQLHLLEAQLAQAQKLESIGQLAAGIAHEINTPSQYIGDNTRFLREAFAALRPLLDRCLELRDGAALRADRDGPWQALLSCMEQADLEFLLKEIPVAIDQSLEGIERVTQIVRSMKEFAHPDGEEMQSIDVKAAIKNTVTISRNEWKYVAQVVTEVADDLPPITCRPGELNQILLNLIVNAAHAIEARGAGRTGTPGTITVRTRRDGEWVEIDVEDTGTGIPETIREKVFDPFFTTKKVGRGTGQGLAIARAIVVERHGGTIDFDTEVGRGTTFKIRMPICPKSARNKENAQQKCNLQQGNP